MNESVNHKSHNVIQCRVPGPEDNLGRMLGREVKKIFPVKEYRVRLGNRA